MLFPLAGAEGDPGAPFLGVPLLSLPSVHHLGFWVMGVYVYLKR